MFLPERAFGTERPSTRFPPVTFAKEGFWKRMKIGRSLTSKTALLTLLMAVAPMAAAQPGRSWVDPPAGKRDGARSECRAAEAGARPSPATGRLACARKPAADGTAPDAGGPSA